MNPGWEKILTQQQSEKITGFQMGKGKQEPESQSRNPLHTSFSHRILERERGGRKKEGKEEEPVVTGLIYMCEKEDEIFIWTKQVFLFVASRL